MKLRCLLFVPGDRPDRMRKALASGADAMVLDLEDSVAAAAKDQARREVAAFISGRQAGPAIFVRLNGLTSGMLHPDLQVVRGGRPYGVMLPKSEGPASVAQLAQALGDTDTKILPVVTEIPAAVFRLGEYSGVSERLCGLTWGAEDLSAALGASTARETDGRYRPPYELARSLTLFAAHAAGVPAYDTVYPTFSDVEGLGRYASRARQDGFAGMLAIHPSQVEPIRRAFLPDEKEIAWARRVVAAFAQHGGAGALSVDGRMLDAPHLAEARRLLSALDSQ